MITTSANHACTEGRPSEEVSTSVNSMLQIWLKASSHKYVDQKHILPSVFTCSRRQENMHLYLLSLPSSKVISLSVENSYFCAVEGVLHEKMDSSPSTLPRATSRLPMCP